MKKRFYKNERFAAIDRDLSLSYLFKSPYTISKEFLKKQKQKDVHTYGETPLTTLEKIAKECHLTEKDCLIEMGAGRGRAALFFAEYIGARVKAYERIPDFVELGNKIGEKHHSSRFKMILGDMLEANFSKATAVYLFGTMLTEIEIGFLIEKLPPKIKVITVSYPLRDYSDRFIVKKTFSAQFAWGETEIFWNEKMEEKLSQKKCVPCRGETPPLKGKELIRLYTELGNGWKLEQEMQIEKTYSFKDFQGALHFTNEVGRLAEEEGHHPKIELGWGQVKLTYWTHKINGLSESDFIMAAKSDALYAAHL